MEFTSRGYMKIGKISEEITSEIAAIQDKDIKELISWSLSNERDLSGSKNPIYKDDYEKEIVKLISKTHAEN
jgi:hypothetical protein